MKWLDYTVILALAIAAGCMWALAVSAQDSSGQRFRGVVCANSMCSDIDQHEFQTLPECIRHYLYPEGMSEEEWRILQSIVPGGVEGEFMWHSFGNGDVQVTLTCKAWG